MPRRKKTEELPPEPDEVMFPEEEEEDIVPFRSPGGLGYEEPVANPYAMHEVSIPLWEDASKYQNGTYRLRVERMQDDGIASSLGFLPATANEVNLVHRAQGKPGTYLVMPVNENGEPLRRAPYRKVIDREHPAVLKYSASVSVGAQMPSQGAGLMAQMAGGGGVSPDMLQFIESIMSSKDAQFDELREYLRRKDEEAQQIRKEALDVQLAVATDHTNNALKVQKEMMAASRAEQEFMHQQQLEMERERREAERASRDAEMERTRQFYDGMTKQMETFSSMMVRMREDEARRKEEDMLRKEEALKEERREKERWFAERDKERALAAERERERDRQHMAMLIELMEKKQEATDPFKSIVKVLEQGTALKDIMGELGLTSGGNQNSGLLGSVTQLATTFLNAQVEMQKAKYNAGLDDDDDGPPLIPMTPEVMQGLSQEELAQFQQQQQPSEQELLMLQQRQQMELAAQQEAEQQARLMRAFGTQAPPEAPPPAAPTVDAVSVPPPPAPMAPPVETSEAVALPAAVARLKPAIQKKARAAIRKLVGQLQNLPEAQWQDAITVGVIGTQEIIPYLTAASIYTAMIEGGASPEMAEKVIKAVDASGLVPASIPRRI